MWLWENLENNVRSSSASTPPHHHRQQHHRRNPSPQGYTPHLSFLFHHHYRILHTTGNMKAINKMLGRKEKPKGEQSSSSSSVVGSTISIDDINVVDKQYSVENRNKEGPYSPSTPTANRTTKGNNKGNVDRLMALNENDKRILATRKQVIFSKKKRGECLLQKGVSLLIGIESKSSPIPLLIFLSTFNATPTRMR